MKENVDNLRKIIKFDSPDKPDEKKTETASAPEVKKKEQETNKKPEEKKTAHADNLTSATKEKTTATAETSREDLETKRTILQNIKDFDFQIKKNQEDITVLTEKLDNLSKDLDDLVSLYEIVSEQMNPFVGLSKVTKKRLDALENFTKEIDFIKTRIGDVESVLEKNSMMISNIERGSNQTEKIKNTEEKLSDNEIDRILDMSLESLFLDQKLDSMISEFIESVKTP